MTPDQEMLKTLKGLYKAGYLFEEEYDPDILLRQVDDCGQRDYINVSDGVFALGEGDELFRIPTVLEVEDKIDKMAIDWQFRKHYNYNQYPIDPITAYYYKARAIEPIHFDPPYTEPKRLLASLLTLDKLAEDNPDKFINLFK